MFLSVHFLHHKSSAGLNLAEVCPKRGVELLLPLDCPWLEFLKSVPVSGAASGTTKCGC